MARSGTGRALEIVRCMPRVALNNLRDNPGSKRKVFCQFQAKMEQVPTFLCCALCMHGTCDCECECEQCNEC